MLVNSYSWYSWWHIVTLFDSLILKWHIMNTIKIYSQFPKCSKKWTNTFFLQHSTKILFKYNTCIFYGLEDYWENFYTNKTLKMKGRLLFQKIEIKRNTFSKQKPSSHVIRKIRSSTPKTIFIFQQIISISLVSRKPTAKISISKSALRNMFPPCFFDHPVVINIGGY